MGSILGAKSKQTGPVALWPYIPTGPSLAPYFQLRNNVDANVWTSCDAVINNLWQEQTKKQDCRCGLKKTPKIYSTKRDSPDLFPRQQKISGLR